MWPGELEPPEALSPDQLEDWHRTVEASPAGVLRAADAAALVQYVILTDASRKLAQEWTGTGCDPASPLIVAMARLSGHILAVERELGFSPASRKRAGAQ